MQASFPTADPGHLQATNLLPALLPGTPRQTGRHVICHHFVTKSNLFFRRSSSEPLERSTTLQPTSDSGRLIPSSSLATAAKRRTVLWYCRSRQQVRFRSESKFVYTGSSLTQNANLIPCKSRLFLHRCSTLALVLALPAHQRSTGRSPNMPHMVINRVESSQKRSNDQ